MSTHPARRSMVGVLRRRLLVVVAVAVVLVGAASVAGLRLLTERNAERQVSVAAESVAAWGMPDDRGVRVIDARQLTGIDSASTVVALLDPDGRVVARSPGTAPTAPALESIARALRDRTTTRADAGARSFLFTEIPLSAEVVLGDGTRATIARALVGIGVEAADRLVTALALAASAALVGVVAVVAAVVTAVVSRTTRSLTQLADRVEAGALEGLADSAAAEFSETGAIAEAVTRLDARRDTTERRLRDFVADASHELRTPLTKIQGWSELHFQRPADGALADRAFQSVVDESSRMRLLVDRLAQLARAEDATTAEERVDLAEVCHECVADAALLDPGASVLLSPGAAGVVLGDPVALTQLVRNLVGNAVLHGGARPTVTVSVTRAGDVVELVVSDDGVGMPPALRDRAFERFATGDRRTGTGLGLAIVHAIASSHGGTVGLESEPGAGTRVSVRLPAAPG